MASRTRSCSYIGSGAARGRSRWTSARRANRGELSMSREQVEIRTRDGLCPSSVFKPEGAGRWPAVIFYMDGLGIRPVLYDMCDRIARDGYVVLLPDLFYRAGRYEA